MPDAITTITARPARRRRTRHGLYSDVDVAAGDEASDDWLDYHEAMLADLKPRGAFERSLASRAAALLWRLRRVATAEADIIARADARARLIHARNPNVTLESAAAHPMIDQALRMSSIAPFDTKPLIEFMRIEAHLNRQLMQTIHELEVARNRREGKPTPLARIDVHGLVGP